ncbi:unnamed protein product [Prorocentrum cordatum]|uniref:Uncharacterized protein n=1 Tax=Prorocentrum cordatum TaxID=2364126 RepID=A0ABN9WP42_9DINO|nr:unnamed protein product [Polarella glacialis]
MVPSRIVEQTGAQNIVNACGGIAQDVLGEGSKKKFMNEEQEEEEQEEEENEEEEDEEEGNQKTYKTETPGHGCHGVGAQPARASLVGTPREDSRPAHGRPITK